MASDFRWVRSAAVASKDGRGQGSVCLAYLSVMSIALELLPNTIQVCDGTTVMGILAFSRVDTGSNWNPGALALLLGDG